ncbi:MAG TPA: ATP-binding cassette domain-containing protein [Mycobacteriales bacterium]|nr:ATP-binding cassette domain-containing protein [Mycobacteriales bacterium]
MTTFAADLYLLVAAYGLAVAVSYAGLPVLGQGAFVAIGAFGTVQITAHGVPLGVAVVAAVALATVAGYLVGFAATRLAGAPLALATWGLAWLAYSALVLFPALGGGAEGLTRDAPAHLVSPALGLRLTLTPGVHVGIALVIDVLAAIALARTARGAWGLDLAALRTGPVLADSIGVPVQRRRRAVLATSAALGALGGAGTAVLLGVVAAPDYSPLLSLQLFVAVLVGGVATWWGPPIGVAILAFLPDTADALARAINVDALRARSVLTAVLLVAVLVVRQPLHRLLTRSSTGRTRAAAVAASVESDRGPDGATVLELRKVVASYGALRVLDGVDIEVRSGEIHALVGPNGSGKSTVLRIATGVVRPVDGEVRIDGLPAPAARAAAPRVKAGVARTLQHTVMLGELEAGTQVEVASRAKDRMPHGGVRELLATPRGRAGRTDRRARAVAALHAVGMDDRADAMTSRLDSAEQRLLQIARAAATGARALLLDEPAAGMSADQRDRLGRILRHLADRGFAVMLVEHDMRLVGRVADRVTVLAEGRVLATGTPDYVRSQPAVALAYLGSSAAT